MITTTTHTIIRATPISKKSRAIPVGSCWVTRFNAKLLTTDRGQKLLAWQMF